jgi:hypothetical protein
MRKQIILIFTFSLILTGLILYPFTAKINNSVVNVIDPLFYAWNLSYNAKTTFQNIEAKLDTNIYYPLTNTLAFSDTLWAQSLFTSPLIWLTNNPVLVENINIYLTFPLSAITMFLLVYWITENSWAAISAGFFYAFSYPRIAQIGHLPFLSSQWLPLVWLFTLMYLKKLKTRYLLAAFTVLILCVGSSIYFGVFILPTLLVIVFIQLFSWIKNKEQSQILKFFRMVIIWLVPMGLIIFITLYPYIRLKIEHPEFSRNLFDTMDLRALPIDFVSVLPTSLIAKVGFPVNTNEHVLYPTLIVGLLSIYGSIKLRKKNPKLTAILLSSAFISLLLSFGAEQNIPIIQKTIKLPYFYLFKYFPLFQTVRVPARLGIFTLIPICVLAGIALDQIMILTKKSTIIYITLIIYFLEIWQINIPFVQVPLKSSIPEVYKWLVNQPQNTIIAELPMKLFYDGAPMSAQIMKTYDSLTDMDNYAAETYRVYFSSFHGKKMLNGYSGFFPTTYNDFAKSMENFPSTGSLNTLKENNVTYIIIHSRQYGTNWSNIKNGIYLLPDMKLIVNYSDDYVYQLKKNN